MISKISKTPKNKKLAAHRAAILIEAVPLSTRHAFKKTCVGRETMRDAFIRLMRFYVRVDGNIPEE